MFDEIPPATLYLSATASGFWQWSENGREINWADGRPLTFLPELISVLQRLIGEGLPPLGSILLLIAASRNNWRDLPSRRELLVEAIGSSAEGASRNLLAEVCDGLDKIRAFPAELRTSTTAIAELAALVLEGAPSRINAAASQFVVESLSHGWSGRAIRPKAAETVSYLLLRELKALREGLRRVDEAALRMRLKTSLETIPIPAPIEPPPAVGRDWLAQLEQNEEFAGLARLAKRLSAVVHFPRRLSDAVDLPVGGVTDIAPRGPLDRLLLSELAHDDLTLAVRVAMNEALYYRRESPPCAPLRQRHVLLDAGLRLWGLPRLFGTAVGLAMIARSEARVEVQVHRATGSGLSPVMMNTLDGLREHLAALDSHLHPGAALPALQALLKASPGGDVVIVTSDDTVADPAFQRALERFSTGAVYLATVARCGQFTLQHYSRAGLKRLSAAHLPLAEILKQPAATAALRDSSRSPLPAIFHLQSFPLLLSVNVQPENSWHLEGLGVYTLSRDGRLLLWSHPARGAWQIAVGLPTGHIFGATQTASGEVCLVIGRRSQHGLHALWISKEYEVLSCVDLQPEEPHILEVTVDTTCAFVRSPESVQAIDLHTGIAARPRKLGLYEEHYGLFYQSYPPHGERWSRLTVQEGVTSLITVVGASEAEKEPVVIRLFEAKQSEGPIGLTQAGDLFDIAERTLWVISHGLPKYVRLESLRRDGAQLVLESRGNRALIDTRTQGTYPLAAAIDLNEVQIASIARPRPLRCRFAGLGVDPTGSLILVSAKAARWKLHLPQLVFQNAPNPDDGFEWKPFVPWQQAGVSGFQLHRVEFPEGSSAVLDSRGLLHLKSSDSNLSECTLVLREGACAGWCSDGRVWGPSYFIGDRQTAQVEEIARDVLRPFLERLQ
ncbi:MAG TPA: hypothetical protein VFE24_05760 [Pirellulales bacterium]|jgi:hypothetical protein|nr:hypothetical protein [Pirellulales bacterium]